MICTFSYAPTLVLTHERNDDELKMPAVTAKTNQTEITIKFYPLCEKNDFKSLNDKWVLLNHDKSDQLILKRTLHPEEQIIMENSRFMGKTLKSNKVVKEKQGE